MKRYNNTVQRGEVIHYFDNEKLYFIVDDNRDNEKKVSDNTINTDAPIQIEIE